MSDSTDTIEHRLAEVYRLQAVDTSSYTREQLDLHHRHIHALNTQVLTLLLDKLQHGLDTMQTTLSEKQDPKTTVYVSRIEEDREEYDESGP